MKLARCFSFVFPDLIRDPALKLKKLRRGSQIKFGMTVTVSLFLLGCSTEPEAQTLEQYFSNKNNIQEQKNSSINNSTKPLPSGESASVWETENYPADCEWMSFERVVDGDTIIVSNDVRVRMIGIDTPESKREGTPVQPYALEATDALAALLEYQTKVCLIEDEVGDAYDTYGRKLSYVFTPTGLDLNAQMLKDGWAEAYTRFPMERAEEFEGLEAAAREVKRGRWE